MPDGGFYADFALGYGSSVPNPRREEGGGAVKIWDLGSH